MTKNIIMKATFRNVVLLFAITAFVTSCKKDETKATVVPGGDMTLTNSGSPAVTFNWDAAKFNYDAAVVYTVQISKGGTNFSATTTTELTMGSLLTKAFTVGEFNSKVIDVVPFGSAQQVQVRIKASVGSNIDPIYSNVITMTVTAYRDIVNYEFPQALRIAGNFQGWSPGTAPKIVDKAASGTTGTNYDGYINLANASPEFKMVKGNDWPAGDFGGSPGILTNGGSNLTVSGGAGVYRITANTVNMTWTATKVSWAITGNATPLGWPAGPGGTPGQDHDLTFNPADGTWSITINLTAGELKFRANDDWGINFGDDAPRDNKPDYGGANIPITSAGNYTITLDIGVAGNYSYTVKKN
jgi:hypothetical protein